MDFLAVQASSYGVSLVSTDDTEDTGNASLEMQMQKRLLDAMFLDKDQNGFVDRNEKTHPTKKSAPRDTVDISPKAIELYSEESMRLTYQNGAERLDIEYERVEYVSLTTQQQETRVQEAEPLVIDLNGNGLELTDVRKGDGVNFDITGDGNREFVSWVAPADGLLAYDRNGNGVIDSGMELFGDQHGAENGFEELAGFDDNADGAIDNQDAVYDKLRIWQDANQNGISEAGELRSLRHYGIDSIDLKPNDVSEVIAGNRVEGYAEYDHARGTGSVGEVFFNYIA